MPTARCHIVDSKQGAQTFVEEVGYPLIAKPNVGVGAADTLEEVKSFIQYVHERKKTGGEK